MSILKSVEVRGTVATSVCDSVFQPLWSFLPAVSHCTLKPNLLSSARSLLSLMLSQYNGVRSGSAVHTIYCLLFRGMK